MIEKRTTREIKEILHLTREDLRDDLMYTYSSSSMLRSLNVPEKIPTVIDSHSSHNTESVRV